jgi:hypothetical protein
VDSSIPAAQFALVALGLLVGVVLLVLAGIWLGRR